MTRHTRDVIVLKRSCITGRVVWAYIGTSEAGAHRAYYRAVNYELKLRRQWGSVVARRRQALQRMITGLTASLPIDAELTPDQKKALRELQALAKKALPFQSDFYDHIIESRRRRAEDHRIRLQMREREKLENRDYGK